MKTYANKFVGLSGDAVPMTTDELAAKFGIPNGRCICYNITSEGNYSKYELIKKTKVLEVPMLPTTSFRVLGFLTEIGIDTNELSIQETVDPSVVELEYVGEI